mmetsp:Transcript_22153/g.52676  ORF Transcript_22153/g.52676 Transcript_22153/m.52676 type:complete len:247 (+) Transcript_22153:897-1637(+)
MPFFNRISIPRPSMWFRDKSRNSKDWESERKVSPRSLTSSDRMSQSTSRNDRRFLHSPSAEKNLERKVLEDGIGILRNSRHPKHPFLFPASATPSSNGRSISQLPNSSSQKARSTIFRDLMLEIALVLLRSAFPSTLDPSRSRRHRSIVNSSILASPMALPSKFWWSFMLGPSKKSQLRPPLRKHEGDCGISLLKSLSSHSSGQVDTLFSVRDDLAFLYRPKIVFFSSRLSFSLNCKFLKIIAVGG